VRDDDQSVRKPCDILAISQGSKTGKPEDYADYGDVDDLLQDSYWLMQRKEE